MIYYTIFITNEIIVEKQQKLRRPEKESHKEEEFIIRFLSSKEDILNILSMCGEGLSYP